MRFDKIEWKGTFTFTPFPEKRKVEDPMPELAQVVFTDRSGIPTVLYKINQFVPEKNREGKAVIMSIKEMDLYGRTLADGRNIVIIHPNNYALLSDACAGRYALQEYEPWKGVKSDGNQKQDATEGEPQASNG